jgi:hypothetical protein
MRASESRRPAVEVTLRIPGTWRDRDEFYSRLPRGCHCTAEALVLPDGSQFELHALPADEEFPQIFANSCAKLPTEREREQVDHYRVNICLTGPGGSVAAAKRLMEAGAAVMAAGGAGAFVDNSGLAHGATDWRILCESANGGGVYWAFVCAVRTHAESYSIGMHVLGFRDAIVPATGVEEVDFRTLHSFLGYTAFSGAVLNDGDMIGDPILPNFRVSHQEDDRVPPDAPMFNPLGRWRLEPIDVSRN